MLKFSSADIELSVEIDSSFYIRRPFYETLTDVRHAIPCHVSEDFRMNRNVSPTKKFHSAFFTDHFKHSFCKGSLKLILWKKEHSYSVVSCVLKLHSAASCSLGKKSVGNLKKDSYTVSNLSAGILSCTVLQLLNNTKCVVKGLYISMSVYIYYCSDTAGIALYCIVV